ncbi:MAG: hypothetical protein AB7R69_01630 [Candidatus Babeliales bacterium]
MKKYVVFLITISLSASNVPESKEPSDNKKNSASSVLPQELSLSTTTTTENKKISLPKTITLQNKITDKTITYQHHWYKPYPSDFKILVNNEPYLTLVKGRAKLHAPTICTNDKKIRVQYEWKLHKFGKTWHHEKRELEFEVPEEKQELAIDFSWDDDYRITLENAKRVCVAESSYTREH